MDTSALAAGNVRAEMGRRQVSRVEMAHRLGVSDMWVGRRLNGQVAITVDDLGRMAEALEVPVVDLLAAP